MIKLKEKYQDKLDAFNIAKKKIWGVATRFDEGDGKIVTYSKLTEEGDINIETVLKCGVSHGSTHMPVSNAVKLAKWILSLVEEENDDVEVQLPSSKDQIKIITARREPKNIPIL